MIGRGRPADDFGPLTLPKIWPETLPPLTHANPTRPLLSSKQTNKQKKILLLNGWHDREIGGYDAVDCVNAVCSALNRDGSPSQGRPSRGGLGHPASTYVTHLVVPAGGHVFGGEGDRSRLGEMGIEVVEVESVDPEGRGEPRFDDKALVEAISVILEET